MVIDTLKSRVLEYYKAKDDLRLGVLKYFLSQVKNKEIELRPQNITLDDEMAFKVLKKQIKQRKEAIELYEKGGRKDLVDKESSELAVLEEFAKLFPFEL
jgi:uncharacterized protein